MNKKKNGAPSKFKDEYCELLIEHMAKGFSFLSFAAIINVNEDTLFEWAKVHPIFSESKKTAFSKSRLFWERLGIDYVVNESSVDRDANTSTSRSLNPSVWIFNMKNRFRDEWREKQEITQETKIEIVSAEVEELADKLKAVIDVSSK